MKKTPLKRKSKTNDRKLQDEIWEHCKRIIRARYLNKDGTWNCYTCGHVIREKKDAHTAHFRPRSVCGAFLRYDLRNLRVCCYMCNVRLGGNGTNYYKNMVEREGQEYVDQIYRDEQKTVKATDHYLLILEEYKAVDK